MENEMSKPLVIYHANCADGFSAAWCFYRKYGAEGADFFPGVYGNNPPDCTGRDVYLVDFSYKRDIVEIICEEARTVTILDHHKTALEDLQDFNHPLLGKVFDMNRSGATIAWDYLFPDEQRPTLLNHVEDRDLWRFKLPGTREIQANVFSYEYTFDNWDSLMNQTELAPAQMIAAGAALERKHHKDIAELLAVCKRLMTIGGVVVPVASLPYTMVSDAAHAMAKDAPFAACYWDTPNERIFGLRSRDDGQDVSAIAKMYGGGGHAHAAGFKVPRDHELAKT
jgi:oligoribonuclease NrnB/cAMP/cGMP phosphodiesterase (DHH superfamily)